MIISNSNLDYGNEHLKKLNKQQRRESILGDVYNLIDRQLILELESSEIRLLIGLKNTLGSSLKVSKSQESAVEEIKFRLSYIEFEITELDRVRFQRIILPRLENVSLDWDSASRRVSYESALVLFEADLSYLLSPETTRRLPADCLDARHAVLANVRTTRLHPMFGTGSKFSYWQYRNLIDATQMAWVPHLRELGVRYKYQPAGQADRHDNTASGSSVVPWAVSVLAQATR